MEFKKIAPRPAPASASSAGSQLRLQASPGKKRQRGDLQGPSSSSAPSKAQKMTRKGEWRRTLEVPDSEDEAEDAELELEKAVQTPTNPQPTTTMPPPPLDGISRWLKNWKTTTHAPVSVPELNIVPPPNEARSIFAEAVPRSALPPNTKMHKAPPVNYNLEALRAWMASDETMWASASDAGLAAGGAGNEIVWIKDKK